MACVRMLARCKYTGRHAYRRRLCRGPVKLACCNHVTQVDPDVETVRNFFKLDKFAWEHMSPVVFPPGFTRKVIDGRVKTGDLLHKIKVRVLYMKH